MALSAEVKQKLDTLVSSDNVVLFMKGTRSFPQCGFSASVVQILNSHLPKYTTVNILSDADVRTGMKDYSEWPTFPQLYIRGEFVGGADIVRQMHETGDLAKHLGDLAAAPTPPTVTVTAAAAAELKAALAEGAAGDVIHVAIAANWDHGLDLGPADANAVTVDAAGLKLQFDRASAPRAAGLRIDFVAGPAGGFRLDNPNRPPHVRQLRGAELKALLDAGTAGKLYDVRTPAERATAMLRPDAVHLDDAAMTQLLTTDKETPLVFFCHHGGRSQAAAEHFVQQGFRQVYNLVGGIDAWSREIDPSVPRY